MACTCQEGLSVKWEASGLYKQATCELARGPPGFVPELGSGADLCSRTPGAEAWQRRGLSLSVGLTFPKFQRQVRPEKASTRLSFFFSLPDGTVATIKFCIFPPPIHPCLYKTGAN